jgi:hypothetical protein
MAVNRQWGRQRGLDRAIVKAMPSRFMAWRSGALHELMAFAVTRRAGQPKASPADVRREERRRMTLRSSAPRLIPSSASQALQAAEDVSRRVASLWTCRTPC